MRSAFGALLPRPAVAVLLALALVALAPASGARPAAFPPLPVPLDRQFLGNLSVPSVAPGGAASLTFSLTDPPTLGGSGGTISRVVVTFEVYAFNGYPGDATAVLPVSNAPVLSNESASGPTVRVSWPSLSKGASVLGSIGISTSAGTPSGTFAIRTALNFTFGGTAYRLESRGWFSATAWASATEEPNGSATLNLTRLGVSGVLPETAVLVSSSDWEWALGALLGGAFVLLAAGAWVYSRRGPGSRSGAG